MCKEDQSKKTTMSKGSNKTTMSPPPRAPQTFHYHSYMKDSVSVQKKHKRTNDTEEHEENPHLQDYLVKHHESDIIDDDKQHEQLRRPTLSRPCVSILHNRECPSRHSCEITESKRRVSFKDVMVRDYDMVLGDNPAVSYGAPVQLGWHYQEYEPLDINEYEFHHARRRPLRDMMLNYYRRMLILEYDNKEEDIKKAWKDVKKAKSKRSITKQCLIFWKIDDGLESAGRKLKRLVKKKPSERWWEPEDELDWSRSMHSKQRSILRGSPNKGDE